MSGVKEEILRSLIIVVVFIHRVITSLRKWATLTSMQSSAALVSRAHHPTLWKGSPSYSMVIKWAAQYKRVRETRLENDPLTNQQITQGHIEMDISYAVIHNEVQVSPHWIQKLLLAY